MLVLQLLPLATFEEACAASFVSAFSSREGRRPICGVALDCGFYAVVSILFTKEVPLRAACWPNTRTFVCRYQLAVACGIACVVLSTQGGPARHRIRALSVVRKGRLPTRAWWRIRVRRFHYSHTRLFRKKIFNNVVCTFVYFRTYCVFVKNCVLTFLHFPPSSVFVFAPKIFVSTWASLASGYLLQDGSKLLLQCWSILCYWLVQRTKI